MSGKEIKEALQNARDWARQFPSACWKWTGYEIAESCDAAASTDCFTVGEIREWLEGWKTYDAEGLAKDQLPLSCVLAHLECEQDGIAAVRSRMAAYSEGWATLNPNDPNNNDY